MEINGLYKLSRQDEEKLIQTFKIAFASYPKLMTAFPKTASREAALEATLRYYVAYDMEFGQAFALDEKIHEGICIVPSREMHYTEERHRKAGSYSPEYLAAMDRLTLAEQRKRLDLFEELDRLEKQVDIPREHLYADFLGVRPDYQNQGRGRRLMEAVCRYARGQELPVMLFTNTEADVAFYKSLGFQIVGRVCSGQFGFTNTYMIREVDFHGAQ